MVHDGNEQPVIMLVTLWGVLKIKICRLCAALVLDQDQHMAMHRRTLNGDR